MRAYTHTHILYAGDDDDDNGDSFGLREIVDRVRHFSNYSFLCAHNTTRTLCVEYILCVLHSAILIHTQHVMMYSGAVREFISQYYKQTLHSKIDQSAKGHIFFVCVFFLLIRWLRCDCDCGCTTFMNFVKRKFIFSFFSFYHFVVLHSNGFIETLLVDGDAYVLE